MQTKVMMSERIKKERIHLEFHLFTARLFISIITITALTQISFDNGLIKLKIDSFCFTRLIIIEMP